MLVMFIIMSIAVGVYFTKKVPVMETPPTRAAQDTAVTKKPRVTRKQFESLAKLDHKAPITLPWVKSDGLQKPPRYFKFKESLLTPVIDQGMCASCWSISTTGMLADRISLYTNGAIMEPLSNQEMISCWDGHDGEGCKVGGIPELAYNYMINKGISLEKDYPYQQQFTNSIAPCNDSSVGGRRVYVERGSVKSLCTDPYKHEEGSEQYNSVVKSNVENMKLELVNHGVLVGTIMVYEDLYDYTGLYVYRGPSKKSEKFVGGHALEIIGYCEEGINGVEPGFDLAYWICKQSWGVEYPSKSPSSKGYFYIEMGRNVAGIESRASSARPLLDARIKKHLVSSLQAQAYSTIDEYVDDPERKLFIQGVARIKGWLK